jgi:hypothetical protein
MLCLFDFKKYNNNMDEIQKKIFENQNLKKRKQSFVAFLQIKKKIDTR